MRLPNKIDPNPLLTSTVEIRFDSSLNQVAVLKTFYPIFGIKYSNLKEATNMPKELKTSNSLFDYTPDYVFSDKDYSVSVGRNVISFENVGTYHLWPNYFKMICENLNLLESLSIIKSVQRIGVRYASFFWEKTAESKILKYKIGFGHTGYTESLQLYQTNLKRDNTNLLLQIAPSAIANNQSGTPHQGFLIDIDASAEGKGNLVIGTKLFEVIDRLHTEEKELFFSILDEDFLKSLNPEY
jgi:uncharacterized protein (TIGR04255 family)